MSENGSFFVAGKFGAAQGVRGAIRVISLMDDPGEIFNAGSWYVLTAALEHAIPASKSYEKVSGTDVDQHLQGGKTTLSSLDSDSQQLKNVLQLSALTPLKWQNHPKGFAVTLSDLTDRDQAQLLTHQYIYLPIEHLESQDEDGYYWRQLIGLSVQDTAGKAQGIVAEMLETGANDVMVVIGPNKERTLVPYIPERVIHSIDLVSQQIVLDWDFDDVDDLK